MQTVLVNLKSEEILMVKSRPIIDDDVPITAGGKYQAKRPLLARSGQASGLSGLL